MKKLLIAVFVLTSLVLLVGCQTGGRAIGGQWNDQIGEKPTWEYNAKTGMYEPKYTHQIPKEPPKTEEPFPGYIIKSSSGQAIGGTDKTCESFSNTWKIPVDFSNPARGQTREDGIEIMRKFCEKVKAEQFCKSQAASNGPCSYTYTYQVTKEGDQEYVICSCTCKGSPEATPSYADQTISNKLYSRDQARYMESIKIT